VRIAVAYQSRPGSERKPTFIERGLQKLFLALNVEIVAIALISFIPISPFY